MPFSEACYSFLKVICHTTLITNKMTMYFYRKGLKWMLFEKTISSVWMMPKVTGKYSGWFRLPQTEAGADDYDFFVVNLIGHDR